MTPQPSVVSIYGDGPTRALIRFAMQENGCQVIETEQDALLAHLTHYKAIDLLIVVDDAAPGVVARTVMQARRIQVGLAIVVLTRAVDHGSRQGFLSLGVTEVVTLPIAFCDLCTRLCAAMRTTRAVRFTPHHIAPPLVAAGGLTLYVTTRTLRDETGCSVVLSQRETALLEALMLTPGRPVGRQELLDTVWGEAYVGAGNVLDVYVRRLRAKLTASAAGCDSIRTVRREGYVFDRRSTVQREVRCERRHCTSAPRVLVVDDDLAIVALMARVLRDEGYEVVAATAEEALTIAQRTHPVLVVLDLGLSGAGGADLYRRLRDNPGTTHIPIVATSDARSLRVAATESAFDDYLSKPFTIDELLIRTRKWAGAAVSIGVSTAVSVTARRAVATLRQA